MTAVAALGSDSLGVCSSDSDNCGLGVGSSGGLGWHIRLQRPAWVCDDLYYRRRHLRPRVAGVGGGGGRHRCDRIA
jgi:hypothetical protein